MYLEIRSKMNKDLLRNLWINIKRRDDMDAHAHINVQ